MNYRNLMPNSSIPDSSSNSKESNSFGRPYWQKNQGIQDQNSKFSQMFLKIDSGKRFILQPPDWKVPWTARIFGETTIQPQMKYNQAYSTSVSQEEQNSFPPAAMQPFLPQQIPIFNNNSKLFSSKGSPFASKTSSTKTAEDQPKESKRVLPDSHFSPKSKVAFSSSHEEKEDLGKIVKSKFSSTKNRSSSTSSSYIKRFPKDAKFLVVLDTNVFLNENIESIQSLFDHQRVRIGIPFSVISELDNLKDGKKTSPKQKMAIRKCQKMINEFSEPKNGSKAVIQLISHVTDGVFYKMNPQKNDGLICDACIYWKSQFPDREVVLISDDKGIRNFAKSSEIKHDFGTIREFTKALGNV